MEHCKDYEKMDRAALQLRIDYGFTTYAVDVFLLAKYLNISLIKYSELTEKQLQTVAGITDLQDGFTLINKSNKPWIFIIYYNDNMPIERQSFTIAHEIKHVIFQEDTFSDKNEKMANHFARVLLAPSCLIMLMIKTKNILEIAKEFKISTEASNNAYIATLNRVKYNGNYLNDYEIDYLETIKKSIN